MQKLQANKEFQDIALPNKRIVYNEFGKNANTGPNCNSIDISRFGMENDALTEENIGKYMNLLKSSQNTRIMYFTVTDTKKKEVCVVLCCGVEEVIQSELQINCACFCLNFV